MVGVGGVPHDRGFSGTRKRRQCQRTVADSRDAQKEWPGLVAIGATRSPSLPYDRHGYLPSMRNHFDVIVVGLGAMGSSTCCELARRGAKVLGLEQFNLGHALGSSHGQSRMIRLAYYEHPDYVPLLRRAHHLWCEMEARHGNIFLQSGVIYMGAPDSPLISGSVGSASRYGIAHEMFDREQLASRFPHFTVPKDYVGMFEPEAGLLRPESIIQQYLSTALAAGVEVHACEPVTSWEATDSSVTVVTAKATYAAKQVVLTSGAWTGAIVRDLGVKLKVTRQIMAWFWPRQPELFSPEATSSWAIDNGKGGLFYGFPILPGYPGVKVAIHAPGAEVPPNAVIRHFLPGDDFDIRAAIRQYLPATEGPLLASSVCLYTNSPDAHFIVDRHPRHERVTMACGFSGHGFKFSSVMGEILADLALTGTSSLPITFLSLKRFA
jgi:sarcosine oxidase